YGEITVPLNENLLTLQHDTANETGIAEINYNDNKTEGSGDELFQLDDTAECFDENLREEKDSESDFDLNDNHKEERKRKLEYSRKLSQTKRLHGEQYIGYSRSSDGKTWEDILFSAGVKPINNRGLKKETLLHLFQQKLLKFLMGNSLTKEQEIGYKRCPKFLATIAELPQKDCTSNRTILNEENIAIHKPRKDQCDTCCSWETHNISEEEYSEYIEKKKEAEAAKKLAKDTASDEKLVVTMDLQSVLLAPKLEASAIYYKQKLQIHNFTVYALNDKKVDLYVWHEANGNVTANEFTTCIVDYIKMSIENKQSYKHVLISDGCGYQNRNKVLSSALLNVAVELQITIEQLVLERGHTMMESDAVHSSLDAYFKPPIYAPSDYVSRMRQARNHHPYNVHSIDYLIMKMTRKP
ncbi:hypothetical protein CBL_20118, partial [Carabus blaptoides fortunei]